jgi:hypothetical protein
MNQIMASVEQEAAWKSADEARLQPQARLGVRSKYLFRFLPGAGMRGLSVRIDRSNEYVEDRVQRAYDKSFERRVKRIYGSVENMKERLGFTLDSLRDELNGDWIEFTPIPGQPGRQGSCFYATDSDEIAAYLRFRMATGDGYWTLLREEHPTEMITVNGIEIPNTSEGWDAARIAATRALGQIKE